MGKAMPKNLSLFPDHEGHIIKITKNIALDRISENKDRVTTIDLETPMNETTYTQFETEYGGFKVIIEFPNTSEHKDSICEEVKQLMLGLLHEHIYHIVS